MSREMSCPFSRLRAVRLRLPVVRSNAAIALAALLGLLLAGCGEKPQIHSYTVEKQPAGESRVSVPGTKSQEPSRPERMLGGIVPRGEQTWFFKLTGPPAAVAAEVQRFHALLASVQFSNENQPKWTLPEGWREQPGTGMRFATILVPEREPGNDGAGDAAGEKPLELSVISLPGGNQNFEEYALANINRWRDQLKLVPIAAAQLDESVERVTLKEGATALLVDFEGQATSSGMGAAPFASGPFGGKATDRPTAASDRPLPTGKSPLSFDVPEGWRPGQSGGMRKAAFTVTDGDDAVEITIIDLPAEVNDVLSNVNRWRGQVKLGPITAEQLPDQAKKIEVGGTTGDYVALFSPSVVPDRQAILGVIAVDGEKAWFIKLTGDAPLAEREQKNFEAFVKSVKFNSPHGAD